MPQCYRFGQVEIRPAERRILVDGLPVTIGARAFDLLIVLIEHRDRVVSKDELLALVWPGLVVEENNLQVQVSSLRKLLGTNALVTVAGRGYRFAVKLDNASDDVAPRSTGKNNLPAPLNSFVGREREIRDLKELLATTRLVTLTSMGGTGKTRLSFQVAAEVINEYADGVWVVELAPLADPRLLPEAVAAVLGVKEEAGCPVIDALCKFVSDKQLLLLLDNCEHLVEAAAALTKTLLRSGRAVQVLASSRERLHVMGETAYAVPSLAIPDLLPVADSKIAGTQLDAFKQNEAARLFIDRACAAQPSFRVTQKNAAAIANICRSLDGIPLAIELAAARVYAMSVEQIAVRIGEKIGARFNLLTGGDKTGMPHQQTLRASIDWSVDLLSESERALLRQLSVFAGGWTLSAAEAVGMSKAIAGPAALDILIQLVEKSLLIVDTGGERYRLLETVRQYAQERLHDSGEEENARTRHLDFYLALAEEARPALAGPEQGVWLGRLDLERENFLAAHAWARHMEAGAVPGLRLVSALKPYWITRGLLGLGRQMTVDALAHPKAGERDLARCRGLCDAGWIGVLMGRNAEARANLEESLAIAREFGDTRRIAVALQPLGLACLGQLDMAGARAHLREALSMARELGNKREIAAALNTLAQFLRVVGERDAAKPLYEQSLALARELQDREYIAISLLNLTMVSIDSGADERAPSMLLDVLVVAEELGSKRIGQCALEVIAGLAASRQAWACAVRFYAMSEAQAMQTGLQRDPADEAFLMPRIELTREALAQADFSAAEAIGRTLTYEASISDARVWLEGIS